MTPPPLPRRTAVALLLLLAATPVLAQGGPPGMPPAPVRTVEAKLRSLSPTVPTPGSVVSRDDARLAAESAGRLVALAEIGARVGAGDAVARVDQALLREQRLQLEAEISRAQARIRFLEGETDRLQRLADSNVAAQRDLDDTRSQLEVARADLAVVRARLAQNRVEMERSVIRAPFDGLVTQRFVNPGERVSVGDNIVRVVGRERLEVVARVTAANVRFMYPGAVVGIRDDTGRAGVGEVRTIVPLGDSSQPMYELRIDVPADDWIVAQAVELSVPIAAPAELLTVPRDALVLRRDGTYVMRINAEAQAERVEVEPGLSDGALIAVTGDLDPGDRVVVRGAERLRPGQQVRVLEQEQPAPAAEVTRND